MTLQQFIQKTWFYETNLRHYPELQETLLSDQEAKLAYESQIISGNVGVGKTHNAILLVKEYLAKEYELGGWYYAFEPYFMTFDTYLTCLHDYAFGSPEMKSQAIGRLREFENSQFLIFDDFHINLVSEYQRKTTNNNLLNLFSILYAKRDKIKLIVTTNNTKQEIQDTYGQSVCSRLFGMCNYIEVNGEDKRLQKKLDNL